MIDDTKTCPVCAETIKAAAVKCRFCMTDLVALDATRPHEAETERILFAGHPAVVHTFWQWLPIVLTLGLAWVYYWVQSRSVYYEVSTQRVKIERGLLSKARESVELFRIDHFDLLKPLGMRLAGHCLLRLRSSDTNFATIDIQAISDLEALGETLRECSLHQRARRRVTTFVQA